MLRWVIWSVFVIAWTLALELSVADPPEEMPGREVIENYRKLLAKSAHAAVYAFFTVLSAWVPMRQRYRWLMMLFLMVHAWGTEMLQEVLFWQFGRTGSLLDVGFDVLGIVLGVALSWKWWMRDCVSEPEA